VNAKIRAAGLEYLLTRGRGRLSRRRAGPRPGRAAAAHLAGTYRYGTTTAEVDAAAGGLSLRHGGVRNRLRRVDGDNYQTDDRLGWGTKVTFECDGRGRASAVTIGTTRFVRGEDTVPAVATEVPAEAGLRRICGDYGPAHTGLRFFVRGARLACRIEWFYEYDLSPAGHLRFAFPDHGMFEGEDLSFDEGPDGGITAVRLSGIRFERTGGGNA
jgi:hypothetical protein